MKGEAACPSGPEEQLIAVFNRAASALAGTRVEGRPNRRGAGGGSPGFRRHRDGNGHERHGLPSTAIQPALLPAIRHDIHRFWLDRTARDVLARRPARVDPGQALAEL